MHEDVLSDRVQICVGTLDDPDRVRIDDHVWTQQQIAWLRIDDGAPHFAQSSPAVATKAMDQ